MSDITIPDMLRANANQHDGQRPVNDARLLLRAADEIDQLRALVKSAYVEGWDDAYASPDADRDEDWRTSNANCQSTGDCGGNNND